MASISNEFLQLRGDESNSLSTVKNKASGKTTLSKGAQGGEDEFVRFSREEMHDVLGVVRRKKGKAKNKKEEQGIKNGTEGMWELRAFVGLYVP